MHVYRIFDTDADVDNARPDRFRITRVEAQEVMKQTHPQFRCNVQIDLVDVPLDKTNVVTMLDGHGKIEMNVLKSWRGTQRGGITELPAS